MQPVGGLGRIAHLGSEEQQDTQESLVMAVKTQDIIYVPAGTEKGEAEVT